jgi:ABC-type phosphate/phosphonate transport system substrate-binding protein
MPKLTLGAVAYDPKVVTIWDGFQAFFGRHGLDFDYLLYTTYERQVEGHFRGEHDVAWNSPLAWVQARRLALRRGRSARALAMRDSDQDLRSVILVRQGDPAAQLSDLAGRTVGFGAWDSPQATILPMLHLAQGGLEPESGYRPQRFDRLVGKHGDHIGGERLAVQALLRGEVDAACIIDGNLLGFTREGVIPRGALRVLDQTAPYDHCNFTALDGAPEAELQRFVELLLGMSYADPELRALMDLEGLKQWRPGRTEGYAALEEACDRFGTIDGWLAGNSP